MESGLANGEYFRLFILLFLTTINAFPVQKDDSYLFTVKNHTKQYNLNAYYFTITNPSDVLKLDPDKVLSIEKGGNDEAFQIAWNHVFAAYVTISVDIEQPNGTDVASCLYSIDFPYQQQGKPFVTRAMYEGPADKTLYCEYKEDKEKFIFTVRED